MTPNSNNTDSCTPLQNEQCPKWLETLTDSVFYMVALLVLSAVFSPVLVVFGAFSSFIRR
jgi:hypothetical protein